MNYRLLLTEMFIDYVQRMNLETNEAKREVYKEIITDLNLALEIEPNEIAIMQSVKKLIN